MNHIKNNRINYINDHTIHYMIPTLNINIVSFNRIHENIIEFGYTTALNESIWKEKYFTGIPDLGYRETLVPYDGVSTRKYLPEKEARKLLLIIKERYPEVEY